MQLTDVERTGFISHLGAFIKDRAEFQKKYYRTMYGMLASTKWPHDFLPLPLEAIESVIAQEIAEPEFGATIRQMRRDEYVEHLKSVSTILALEFRPRPEWNESLDRISASLRRDGLLETEMKRFAYYGEASDASPAVVEHVRQLAESQKPHSAAPKSKGKTHAAWLGIFRKSRDGG